MKEMIASGNKKKVKENMFKGLLFLLVLLKVAHGDCFNNIVNAANKVLNDPIYKRASWGMYFVTEGGNQSSFTFAHNEHKFFVPASNNKMATTATAFLKFGPEHVLKTDFLLFNNTLCIKASGDASLTSQGLQAALVSLAPVLSKVPSVDVVVDDTLFGPQDCPEGWEWGDMTEDYGAIPTPALLDHGIVQIVVSPGLTVGSPVQLSLPNPADGAYIKIDSSLANTTSSFSSNTLNYAYVLRESDVLRIFGNIPINSDPITINVAAHDPGARMSAVSAYYLRKAGVSAVSFGRSNCAVRNNWSVLLSLPSLPLRNIMNHTLQTSDNLEAEIYMRLQGPTFTWENYPAALKAVKESLSAHDVDSGSFFQTDGSGLGRSNLLAPYGAVSLLKVMRSLEWMTYLPVGGVSGTLADRYIGTVAQGRVHAKTGSLTGVITLSGYIAPRSKNGTWFIFSVLNNGSSDVDSDTVRASIDSIVVAAAQCNNE